MKLKKKESKKREGVVGFVVSKIQVAKKTGKWKNKVEGREEKKS